MCFIRLLAIIGEDVKIDRKVYVFLTSVTIVVLLMLSPFIFVGFLFYTPQPAEKKNSPCLDIVENKLKDRTSSILDFSKIVDCFEWDTMYVTSESLTENYPELEYTYIGNVHNGEELGNVNNWLDGSRDWNYIFFFKNNETIPNAFVICQTELYLRDLINMKFSKNNARFRIGKGDDEGDFRELKIPD